MPRPTDHHTNRIIATRLRSARIGRGMAPADFARRVGCTNNELLAYESGARLVPAVVLVNAVRETGFEASWFFRTPGSFFEVEAA